MQIIFTQHPDYTQKDVHRFVMSLAKYDVSIRVCTSRYKWNNAVEMYVKVEEDD